MKKSLLILLIVVFNSGYGQKSKLQQDVLIWKKAVVNIETEGPQYPDYMQDSIIKRLPGYSADQLDFLRKRYRPPMVIRTGTAIYIKFQGRNYLITAKHVLSDDVLIAQKLYENKNYGKVWNLEAIFPRISIRTSFDSYLRTKKINTTAILNNNFVEGQNAKAFCIISDSTGDGIGIISLQDRSYKLLDTLLQNNGYVPIHIEKICCDESVRVLDEIYTIGFPEMVSVIGIGQIKNQVQSNDVVAPFVVKGSVSLYQEGIQHYFVDLTITPGNSGGPIIKNGKLIGIVSGINTYRIINENSNNRSPNGLLGIGHLVNIINTAQLIKNLKTYKAEEDLMLAGQGK